MNVDHKPFSLRFYKASLKSFIHISLLIYFWDIGTGYTVFLKEFSVVVL